ncbi:MAG: YkgJ family cysteine cluster protein [Bryobacterales bacterium]|nr:YkgJ family cysteine cluster protein [Bryobacterales bacterium]
MITGLAEVRRLAESKAEENRDFRRRLAAHHYPEEPFHILAAEIQSEMDCTQCANCCRQMVVSASDAAVEAIADHLNIPPEEVIRLYTMPDPKAPGNRLLRQADDACIFLDGNLCMIYEVRPKACRDFPHVAAHPRTLGSRFSSLCRNAWLCPIIYNAIEGYKRLAGYTSRGRT